MTTPVPQSFIIRQECEKAAWQHGFRLNRGGCGVEGHVGSESDGWAAFASTTARGTLWLGAAGPRGPWLLAIDHPGVVREWQVPPAADVAGPGLTRYMFPTLTALYAVLPRLYQLATSLPDAPLHVFQHQTARLPRATEVERLTIQRIGQDIFRNSLLDYWQTRCPLTGITDPALLRASHIIPWSECKTDAERLDVHNGLLLSALWDAAFDRALVTFDDTGTPQFSPKLSPAALQALSWSQPIPITAQHYHYLISHSQRFQRDSKCSSDLAI